MLHDLVILYEERFLYSIFIWLDNFIGMHNFCLDFFIEIRSNRDHRYLIVTTHKGEIMKITSLLSNLMAAIGLISLSASAQAGIFPDVADDLELELYLGKWYQVASTNPAFQADCVCVTAEYEINEAGNVDVINTCVKGAPGGEIDIAVGEATATNNAAKFNVSFGGFQLPFSNYWVVDLAEDYSYAVVSTPFRRPVWILSRTPELAPDTLAGIYDRLEERRFPVGAIESTLQAGCNN